MFTNRPPYRQNGLTLIELVMFIVIVGVAVAGILMVMTITTKHSADPMIRKQALAIAESLLEEIELQPFTYCLPTDANAETATSAAACTAGQSEDVLPAASRVSGALARDAQNVADYNQFAMNGIHAIDGTSVGGLEGYNANVTVSQDARGGIQAVDSLRIDVTVTPPNGDAITLTGYRFRYAPRAVP